MSLAYKIYQTLAYSRWSYLVCFISGGLLTLGFAPFDQHWLGIISPLILFACWQHASAKKALLQGWLFGLGLFGTGASWVYVSIATYGNTNIFVAGAATILFVAVLALSIGLNGWFNGKFFSCSNTTNQRLRHSLCLLIIYPTTWVIFEWIRSWLFTGFPWLYIGYTQSVWPLVWYAPIGSVYLVSWLTLITSGVLLFMVCATHVKLKGRFIALMLVATIWLGGWGLSYVNWSQATGKPLKVALIQGNISQGVKWNQQYLNHIIDIYTHLTEKNWHPIVVWPENALPVFSQNIPHYLPSLKASAQQHNSAVLVGMPIYHHKTKRYYNGAVIEGNGKGIYLKRHLVPFGEYVPFSSILGRFFQFMHIPMSNFSSGPDQQPILYMHDYPVALFICYESAFPQEIRHYFNHATWLMAISDDAWFGHSIGPMQQQQMAQMRALETSRYVLRATNNGITSIINQHGVIVKQAPQFVRTVLTGEVTPMAGTTFWVKVGLWPWLILWFGIMLIGYIILMLGRQKK